MNPEVPLNPGLVLALDLGGIFVFALSGALLAQRRHFDVVGLIVLAEITAIGGGVIRDLIIGAVPPAAFTNVAYLLIPLAAASVTFFAYPQLALVERPVLVYDAAGLALFCVAGATKALAFGLSPIPAIVLGVITGVGGGVLRDVLAGETPTVLRADSELYAVPALLGASITVGAQALGLAGPGAAATAVAAAFVLRILGIWRGWRAPTPRPLWPRRAADYDETTEGPGPSPDR